MGVQHFRLFEPDLQREVAAIQLLLAAETLEREAAGADIGEAADVAPAAGEAA